jgi:hypothetical protein
VAEEAPRWEDIKRVGKSDFEMQAIGCGGKLCKEMEWFHHEVGAITGNHHQNKGQADDDSEDQKEQDGETEEDDSSDEDVEGNEADQEESDEERHDHTSTPINQ